MEVYMIHNTANGKVYIGSTIHTKEDRWGQDNKHSRSHLACANQGCDGHLYQDIRKFSKEVFRLVTLEDSFVDTKDLRRAEDKWIKYYWDMLGEHMMYNQIRGERPHNTDGCHTEEVRQYMQDKYGDPYGRINEPEVKRKSGVSRRCNYYMDHLEFSGPNELLEYFHEQGIFISKKQLFTVIKGKVLNSYSLRTKYPELANISIYELSSKERQSGITLYSKYGITYEYDSYTKD